MKAFRKYVMLTRSIARWCMYAIYICMYMYEKGHALVYSSDLVSRTKMLMATHAYPRLYANICMLQRRQRREALRRTFMSYIGFCCNAMRWKMLASAASRWNTWWFGNRSDRHRCVFDSVVPGHMFPWVFFKYVFNISSLLV